MLRSRGLLRARVLPPRGDVARVALVQTAASLLSGDSVAIDVRCGPGARLELIEVAGMVAHDVRGGAAARLALDARVADGARLSWAAQPLVLAEGCDLLRSTCFTLEGEAVLTARDTIILGRHGEVSGRLRSHTTVLRGGAELHVESLDTGDRALLHSPVVAGDANVLDTVALYGVRGSGDPDVLQLHGPGSLLPLVADGLASSERRCGPLLTRWRDDVLDPQPLRTCLDTSTTC